MRRAVDYSGEIEAKLRAEGLLPVRSGPFEVDTRSTIRTNRVGVEAMLRALGCTWQVHNTHPNGRGATEMWVTPAVYADLLAVAAARVYSTRMLSYSLPKVARTLAKVPETFRSFCAALALGACGPQLTEILAHVPRPHCRMCSPGATAAFQRVKTGGR